MTRRDANTSGRSGDRANIDESVGLDATSRRRSARDGDRRPGRAATLVPRRHARRPALHVVRDGEDHPRIGLGQAGAAQRRSRPHRRRKRRIMPFRRRHPRTDRSRRRNPRHRHHRGGTRRIFRGRRGRHGALATWTWNYTSDIPDEAYDVVAVLQAIQHADDWTVVGKELLRTMKRGRSFVLTEITMSPRMSMLAEMDVHLEYWLTKIFAGVGIDVGELPYYSLADLQDRKSTRLN